MCRRYHGRNALIERWNKYHPINREVAHHIEVLEQQGERIRGRWIPQAELDVLALCGWAVRNASIETRWWAGGNDIGGWSLIDEEFIWIMMKEWHPKRVMDFFKYWYSEDVSLEDDTTCLADDLKEAADPLHATQLVLEVLSLNLSTYLYDHFIEDKADDF